MREKTYYTYILSNRSKTLYTGVTNNLTRRMAEHREGVGNSFTTKYKIDRLVYFEQYRDVRNAITCEKQIKNMHRVDKLKLIIGVNPEWRDLSEEWEKLAEPVVIRRTRTTFEGELPNAMHPEHSDREE